MRVLVACEFSGIVREAFSKKGHDAWSCDLLPTEILGNHIQDNVLNHLDKDWDLMIGHPDCTYMTNAGVCWLHKDKTRWGKLEEACTFFKKLQNAPIPKICLENPIPHKYAREEIGYYTQIIQPYQFGHPERKATCLWLKNLPKLKPTNIVGGRENRIHKMSPSSDRGLKRSLTYYGIAHAMAEQWG